MHHRVPQQFPDSSSSMLYGMLAGTQPMAPNAMATTHLPPALLTQFQHALPRTTPSIHSQPSFASSISPQFSSTGWHSSQTDLHEHHTSCMRHRSRTGYAEMAKLRGYSPSPSNPENSRELTDLKEMLKESDTDGEERMWKQYHRYSGNDAQTNPMSLVSGPPPAVTVSATTAASAQRSLIPQTSSWFGAEEQSALNEYYKNHPYPGQRADTNASPSQNQIKKPTISISRESHKTVVNTELSSIDVETLQRVLAGDESVPSYMKYYNNVKSTPSPTRQSFSITPNNSPSVSRVASISTSQNTEKSENVVFLRNYRGSPFNSLTSQSSELVRAAQIKNSPTPPAPQNTGQFRNTAKVEFLQVGNPQQMVTYETVPRNFEKDDVLEPRAPIYHYVYPTPEQQGQQPMQHQPQPMNLPPHPPPPQFSYGPIGGLLSPAPSPKPSPPPSNQTLPQLRPKSATSQRPRPQPYFPVNEQQPMQMWPTQPDAFHEPYCPLPSQPPQVLPNQSFQLPAPMSGYQLPPTPPTPPNEPRRFKPTSWPSNTIWVPGERPQALPPIVPAPPSSEPPRFLPMSSAVPVSMHPFPPILFNSTYPGFEGFQGS